MRGFRVILTEPVTSTRSAGADGTVIWNGKSTSGEADMLFVLWEESSDEPAEFGVLDFHYDRYDLFSQGADGNFVRDVQRRGLLRIVAA